MSDINSTSNDRQSVGTRFPFINLEKAVGRAGLLFEADQRGREMLIASAFAVWKYSEKSSGGFQTIAALKMYGLLKDTNGGDSRKVALTDEALRYFRDEREDERIKLLRGFALHPKLIASLWKDWGPTPPADTIARSHLKAERHLHDQGSRSLLAIYKENLEFAKLKGSDKVLQFGKDADEEDTDDTDEPHVSAGDWVQWTSQGAWQFPTQRRVANVFRDEKHGWQVSVEGYPGALPMEQIEVVGPPKPAATPPFTPQAGESGQGQASRPDPIEVFLSGGRLQISANIGRSGIAKLKTMLEKYDEILALDEKAKNES